MIFKIHYGLWYGGLVGIIPFMFNYAAEYAGASATQHGVLYTILPFVALLTKPLVCSLADKYQAHKLYLLFFIFTTMLGFGSLAVYPFVPNLTDSHKDIIWILYCLAALVGNTSMCVVNSLGDSLTVNSCQKTNTTFGTHRLWGPIGFGVFGIVWGFANEIPSMPKYTPGILTMIVILAINSLIIATWRHKDDFKILDKVSSQSSAEGSADDGGDAMDQTKSSLKVDRMSLLIELGRQHSSIFAFILLFTFCGIMTGIHWQFFFGYLGQICAKDKQNFSLLTALALPVQTLGGELVFFMLSGIIMKKLGASVTLVLCLFSFAARYLLYAYLIPNVSVYWILLVELLQGPAFGLMYSVMTYQANHYSKKIDEIISRSSNPNDLQLKNSLHATLQGALGASFEVSHYILVILIQS